MKNIKITHSCLVGGEHAEAGTILKNVDTRIAADLVGSGRAVDVTRPEKDEPAVGHRDPTGEDRDPKQRAGKRSAKAKDEPEAEKSE